MLHATSLRIPVVEVEGGTLTAVAGFDGHQGIALVVDTRRWSTPAEILARAAERGAPPLVLVLDSLEDPQNLGTLLRTAEASGVHGAVFPTRRQAPLSPAAVKASAGAVEHLLLAPVDDLPGRPRGPPRPWPADRGRGRRRGVDGPRCGPAGTDRDRRGKRGSRPECGRPPALRPPGPDPDARPDRVPERRRGRVDPALRGGRPATPAGVGPGAAGDGTIGRREPEASTEPVSPETVASPASTAEPESADGRTHRPRRPPSRPPSPRPSPPRRSPGARGSRAPDPMQPAPDPPAAASAEQVAEPPVAEPPAAAAAAEAPPEPPADPPAAAAEPKPKRARKPRSTPAKPPPDDPDLLPGEPARRGRGHPGCRLGRPRRGLTTSTRPTYHSSARGVRPLCLTMRASRRSSIGRAAVL